MLIGTCMWGHLLEYSDPRGADSPSSSSHQLPILPHLVVGLHELLHNPCLHFDWLGIAQILCMQLQLLWVHQCNSGVMFKRQHFMILFPMLCLFHWFCPLFPSAPWTLTWGGWSGCYDFELTAICSQHLDCVWVSALLPTAQRSLSDQVQEQQVFIGININI